MLLNNELRYYTLYTWQGEKNPKAMASELINIVRPLGKLKSVELNDYGAVEFWVSDAEECHMYVFFNYDQGVIKV